MSLSLSKRQDSDAELTIEDVNKWETENGIIPEGAIVIMYSGRGQFYGNRTAYLGWPAGTEENNPTDTENLHFPGISPKTAEWLVENRYYTVYRVDHMFGNALFC